MKKRFSFVLVLAILLAGLPGGKMLAKDAPAAAATAYFDPASIDARAILPAPPLDNSDATEKEVEIILQEQASRTEPQLARIKLEEHYNIFVFSNVVGSWFTAENSTSFPHTARLLERVMETAKPVVVASKKAFNRPRPFLLNSRIIPPIERPKDTAYPSGHSTRGYLDALVLSALMPDEQNALMARGAQIGDDRVAGGVHFPSDVLAGRKLAQVLFDRMMASPGFKDDVKMAKAELDQLRKKLQ